jgi:uncharacterized protein YbjQ (UPF0145 family)
MITKKRMFPELYFLGLGSAAAIILIFILFMTAPIISFSLKYYDMWTDPITLFQAYNTSSASKALIFPHVVIGTLFLVDIVWMILILCSTQVFKNNLFSTSQNIVFAFITSPLLLLSIIALSTAPDNAYKIYGQKAALQGVSPLIIVLLVLAMIANIVLIILRFTVSKHKLSIKSSTTSQAISNPNSEISLTTSASNTIVAYANIGIGLWTSICMACCNLVGKESKAYLNKQQRLVKKCINSLKLQAKVMGADEIIDINFALSKLSCIATAKPVFKDK